MHGEGPAIGRWCSAFVSCAKVVTMPTAECFSLTPASEDGGRHLVGQAHPGVATGSGSAVALSAYLCEASLSPSPVSHPPPLCPSAWRIRARVTRSGFRRRCRLWNRHPQLPAADRRSLLDREPRRSGLHRRGSIVARPASLTVTANPPLHSRPRLPHRLPLPQRWSSRPRSSPATPETHHRLAGLGLSLRPANRFPPTNRKKHK